MDDVRQLLLAVFVDVVHAEALGEQHVDLDGDEGVFLAVDVLILDVELRAVECSLVDADGVVDVEVLEDALHHALGVIPLLLRALVLVVRVRGIPLGEAERALVKKADGAEAVLGKVEAALELLFELVGTQDEVAFGDRELTHADEAVHLAGILVAEQRRGLAQAHRQVAVGALAVQVDLILERAGHRAQGEALLRLVIRVAEDEHAVEIVIPVAGDLVKVALGHQRGLGEKIAALLLGILDPALEHLHDARALGQQHRKTLTDAVDGGEIFELAAELVVVALDGLLALFEVGVQLVLLREGDTVDALKRLAVGVAAPVGGVAGGQLDAVALDAAGGVEVRTGAEVGELALLVEADDGILRQVVDELDLERLFLFFHKLDGLGARELKALELELFLADLAHFGFDLSQILRREGERGEHIVVETVVDARADGELHLGPEALDGLRQHMGAGVPIGLAVLGIFKRELVLFADLDFFRHVIYLHFHLRVQKSSTPDVYQG